MVAGSVRDVERLRNAGIGTASTFIDDVAKEGLEGAVKTRFDYFKDKRLAQAEQLAKAQDPNSRTSGIKPTYAGTFGGEKTLSLDKISDIEKGLETVDHPLAGSATRRPLTVSDLEGKTMTVLAGDQARVALINKVMGIDVGGIPSLGGRDNARFGYGWQSDEKKMARLAEIIESLPDESVLGALPPMGGAASDFQHTMAELLVKMSDPKSVTKSDAKTLDALINPVKEKGGNTFKDYPGIKSDEFHEWFLRQSNTARHAMTEPELINKVVHNTDPSVRDFNYFDPSAQMVNTNKTAVPQPSFVDAGAGGIYGRMKNDAELPMSLLFDDYFVGAGLLGKHREKTGLQKSAAGSIAQNMPMQPPKGSGILGLGEPRALITPEKAEDIADYYKIWDSLK